MKKHRDLGAVLLILCVTAVFFAWMRPVVTSPTPVPIPKGHRALDIAGVRLGMTEADVTAILGTPPKKSESRWEYSAEDTAPVQTVSYDTRHRVIMVTGTALGKNGRVLCQTGSTAAVVKSLFGKPASTYSWNKDAEVVWEYPRSSGTTMEIHMDKGGTRVLHVRIYD